MASIHDYDLPPPKPWERFEDLIWDLFKELWSDPHAQKVGTFGQAQHGVDVFGHPDRGPELEGVQCKRNDERPSEAELRQIVEDAKAFEPRLDSLVVATSTPSDTRLQQQALALSRENQQTGWFRVTVMGWNEIQRRLKNYPDLVRKYYGNLFPPSPPPATEPPRLVFALRDEGEQPGRNGPQRVISLIAENRGGGVVGEFLFQMQVPFVPPDVTQPIAPDRVIRPFVATERDGANWSNWRHWHYTQQGRKVLGITIHSFGEVKLFRPMELILCQFHLPVGWFSSTPRPTTYECPYALVHPPDTKQEGVIILDLFELIEGCY